MQLQEYKEKHCSNYTRFRKQTERESLLLDDSCIVVQRKDANQINNRNNNKKRTQRLQRYEENQCGNLTIVQTMGVNQNTNHNNNEDCFALQLHDNKGKHSSNYTRIRKQIERERFYKQARINNKNYKARMRKAHHHAWKPNNTP